MSFIKGYYLAFKPIQVLVHVGENTRNKHFSIIMIFKNQLVYPEIWKKSFSISYMIMFHHFII